jgi:hypothetical protein
MGTDHPHRARLACLQKQFIDINPAAALNKGIKANLCFDSI